ncbi:MAG: aminopeptidase P family protein [Bacteroidales bacterium]|nr:aminopeptidase P family protein [Bacteroidales bacterium]
MFPTQVYQNRRDSLKKNIQSGVAVFLANEEAPMNYPSNTYRYRQDSNFLYFFGLSISGLAAVIDFDEGREIIFGDDFGIDDIIWMGPQPTVRELAEKVGVKETRPMGKLADYLKGRKVHFTPPYRFDNMIKLSKLTGIAIEELKSSASVELIKGIVALRSAKDSYEIEQMEDAGVIGVKMHTEVMRHCRPGVCERELAGLAEGIANSYGEGISFPVILSQHGETLHNHAHNGILTDGNFLLMDAGAENKMNYCSDHTRTYPVNGKFTQKQKEIYEIVLKANMEGIAHAQPGINYLDVHFIAAEIIAKGLTDLGIMKGDPNEAAHNGAYALFCPHGLGHQLGLDVHDMEDLGENYVGYDETISRSNLFGISALRMARELREGFIITVEPGIYFVPELIDIWKSEKKFADFINYDKVEEYRTFGGIRIEDDVLITKDGHKVIGPHLPKAVDELENIINK